MPGPARRPPGLPRLTGIARCPANQGAEFVLIVFSLSGLLGLPGQEVLPVLDGLLGPVLGSDVGMWVS